MWMFSFDLACFFVSTFFPLSLIYRHCLPHIAHLFCCVSGVLAHLCFFPLFIVFHCFLQAAKELIDSVVDIYNTLPSEKARVNKSAGGKQLSLVNLQRQNMDDLHFYDDKWDNCPKISFCVFRLVISSLSSSFVLASDLFFFVSAVVPRVKSQGLGVASRFAMDLDPMRMTSTIIGQSLMSSTPGSTLAVVSTLPARKEINHVLLRTEERCDYLKSKVGGWLRQSAWVQGFYYLGSIE